MSDAFIRVLLPLWPFYLAFLLYAEFSAYCYANRTSARVQAVGYTVWLVMVLVPLYATSPAVNAPQVYALAYVLVAAWTVAVPLGAINLGSRCLAGRDAPLLRQIGLIVLTGIVFVCWPLFGLASFCMSGVDCV
jgi:hypothetical protein